MWFIFLSFQDASMLEINKYVALVERWIGKKYFENEVNMEWQ